MQHWTKDIYPYNLHTGWTESPWTGSCFTNNSKYAYISKESYSTIGNIHKNRTSLCLQQRLHTEVRNPTKTTCSHAKKKNSEWCSRHIHKFWNEEMWPPSFPDLYPMDFCVWSFLETKACSVAHTSVEALKRSLVQLWAKIPQEHYRAAVDKFQEYLLYIWSLMLRKAMFKSEAKDWFLRIFPVIMYIFFVIYPYFELLVK